MNLRLLPLFVPVLTLTLLSIVVPPGASARGLAGPPLPSDTLSTRSYAAPDDLLPAPALAVESGVPAVESPSGGSQGPFADPFQALAIATGDYHSCALTNAGGVKCWGWNYFGQLGDGTTTTQLSPVDVSGLTDRVTAIAAGATHTCALTNAGGVKCWGRNNFGQLGDGTTIDRLTPVEVSGLTSGVSAIDAGATHTCALTSAGGVKCWGWNFHGQLGDGTTTQRLTPVEVSDLASGVTGISAGNLHTCALTSAGGVKCWGNNYEGQLGDGTTTNRLTPANVSSLTSGARAIAAGGAHSCALTSDGGARCWGSNEFGQLGDGTTIDRLTPADVSGLTSGMSAVVGGGSHACALTSAGSVKCWGQNNFGQLGDGTTTDRRTPVDVSDLGSEATAVAASFQHTCALTGTGGIKCWGWNDYGQLGDGTTTTRLTPVDVGGSGAAPIRVYLPLTLRQGVSLHE